MTQLKARLLFFVVTAALYPLLSYVIVPWINSFTNFREGTDAAGAGMASAFAYIYGCLFAFIITLILSIICGQYFLKAWWLGIVACVVGCVTIWCIENGGDLVRDYIPYSYARYDHPGNRISEEGKYIGTNAKLKHGLITKYREDGTVESTQVYKRDEPRGRCELFYPSGKIKAQGRSDGYIWDKGERSEAPDGEWTYYFENGNVADERTYKSGELLRSKNYTLLYDSAKIIRTISDRQPFTGRLEKTEIVGETLFPNLVTTEVINGLCEGEYSEYYNLGNELILAATATLKNNTLEGELKKYHPNGQLKTTAFYSGGKLEGEYTAYYADSTMTRPQGTIEYNCNYKNGQRHGTARWYYENGQLDTETEFVAGIRQGISSEYDFDNGSLKLRYHYSDNEKDGAYEEYYDGRSQKGRFAKGELVLRECYREDGTLESVYEWKEGECIRSDEYDEQGKLVK